MKAQATEEVQAKSVLEVKVAPSPMVPPPGLPSPNGYASPASDPKRGSPPGLSAPPGLDHPSSPQMHGLAPPPGFKPQNAVPKAQKAKKMSPVKAPNLKQANVASPMFNLDAYDS